jgi:glycosyltransferase involved in cell wall biosynthesis
MRIAFIGDLKSANTKSWLEGLGNQDDIEIHTWSLDSDQDNKSGIKRMFRFLFGLNALRKWVKELKPDLLIGYRTTSYGFMAALSGFQPYVIAVQGETDLWPYNPFTLPLKKLFKRYAIKKASMIHAWGANMVPSLLEHGAREEQILVMPRGIDIDKFSFAERNFGNRKIKVIVTRSLYPEYHHKTIIKAISILKKEGREIDLVIVGEGVCKEELGQLVDEYGLASQVTFMGYVTQKELPVLLNQSDFYISTPETEGTSASLFEAMACGCIPIVSDLPANRAWIKHGENGGLVPFYDAEYLANFLGSFSQKGELLKMATQANRKQVELNASRNKNMGLFVERYQSLINRKS